MKNRFALCCAAFFIVFTVFMAWYIPSISSIRSRTAETRQSLETSRGREKKQQTEYDKAVTELPVILEELKIKEPLALEAEQKVSELITIRNELREEKNNLEENKGVLSDE